MGDVPFDRLTELTVEMSEPLNTAENADVRGIIFLQDGERGGIQMFGYDDIGSGMAALFVHMKAIFEAQGKSFGVMTDQGFMLMPERPLGDG
jgi:hypothetical protein